MARPFWAQFSTSGSSSRPPSKRSQKKELRRKKARADMKLSRSPIDGVKAGPPSIFERFHGRGKDPWTAEKARRREEVREEYVRGRKHWRIDKLRRRKELKRVLARRKREIRAHYQLDAFEEDDPRLKRQEKLAQRKYQAYERKMKREHHDDLQKTEHTLENDRDQQYRDVSAAMKREYRADRDVSGSEGGPIKSDDVSLK